MRKILFCSSVFLMLIVSASGYADEQFPFLAQVSRESVNVRAGPNTNFEVIDKLMQGAEVVVLAHSYEWYKIQLPSTAAAYVRADYIKVHRGDIGEILGSRVNVRAKASSDSSPLGQLVKGNLVKLAEKKQDWWKLDPPAGVNGWVHQDFLKLKSAQVPAQLVRKPLELRIDEETPQVKPSITPSDVLPVSVQGWLQALPQPAASRVHYQILVGGKPVYYLRDAPNLDRFRGSMVKVEGRAVVEGSSAYPVLQVKKISLVL